MSTISNTETNTTNTSVTPATPTKINPEQAVAFAALILADDGLTITPEKLQALLRAAGLTEIEPIWTTIFTNALKNKDIKEILTTVATSSPEAGGDDASCTSNCDGSTYDVDLDSDTEEGYGCTFCWD
ncbi:hypothetical protein C7974DRAFT_168126 [Boeremia exigua]|uniref:uncharacterized protein n=1 Tax=Boeremia exigua TaxID=749465 RepID=UPI001E8E3C8A|nr:uncharacterized protein C7974DRAFT_168126 [Boeremia exigua]KAH6633253.1 hypothetical protein C7974DRAFT_168126 [Boeremia exigua]